MKKLNGNVTAEVQVKTVAKNNIGEGVETWAYRSTITGHLDYMGGNAGFSSYYAKLQETTHIFVCNYTNLGVNEAESRLKIGTKFYDILLIDNPMELNFHLEIYLKYVE